MSKSLQKTILLVEDEMLVALTEKILLEKEGYRVVTAVEGNEAINIIKSSECIDLILMDIDLGEGLDGTEAALIILENNDIPVVFLSSHTEREVVKKTEGITSYGYIVKNSGETIMLASIGMAFKLFEAKQEIKRAKNTLDSTFNSINDGILLLDLDNNILKCNDAFKRFKNLDESQILGKKCFNIVHGSECPPEGCPYNKMFKSGKREKMDMPVGDKFYEVIVDPLYDSEGKLSHVVHIISDVTKHKNIEQMLEMKIKQLTRPENDSSTLTFEDLFNLDEIQNLQDIFSSAIGLASVIKRVDGTPITRPSNFTSLCNDFVLKTDEGLARCMQTNETAGQYSTTGATVMRCNSCGLLVAGAGIVVDGKLIAKWQIGQVRDEDMTESDLVDFAGEIGVEPQGAVRAFKEIKVMTKDRFTKIAELLLTTASMLSTVAYHNLQQSRMLHELQSNEKEIKKLLSEKDTLLKEVHHRLKNNLFSVESLLLLQMDSIVSSEALDALKDAVLRIKSVRILYEKLLSTEQYENMPVKLFVTDILDGIKLLFPDYSFIDVVLNIEDLIINSSVLFQIGLVINELVTNIFKHAFTGRKTGILQFSMKKEEEYIIFEIDDDGKGLHPGFSVENSRSFGLKLVKMITEELKGDFSIENKIPPQSGTVCRMKMKAAL